MRQRIIKIATVAWLLSVAWLSAGNAFEAAAPGDPDAPLPTISAVRIQIDKPPDPAKTAAWSALAENLIPLQKGDRLSAAAVERAVAALKASGRFEAIHVDSVPGGDRVTLWFHLTPVRQIKDIRLHGLFPLFEGDVLRAMTVSPGDVFSEEALAAQAEQIRVLYRREGFASPQADITAGEDPQDGQKIIDIRIRKGPFFTVSGIDIAGNRSFSDFQIKRRMKTWRWSQLPGSAGRFVERDLETDVKALVQFYRTRSYPEVAIDVKTEKNERDRSVKVSLTVREGPRYTVTFAGNRHFSNRDLHKELVIFHQGNRNGAGMQKSVRAIRKRYRAAGFKAVKVTVDTVTRTGDRGPVKLVAVSIAEGVRTVVRQVTIDGNRTVSTAAIADRMLTRTPGLTADGAFQPDVLEADVDAVKALYLQKGFASPEIQPAVTLSPDRSDASVRLTVNEGPRTLVSAVTIDGARAVTREQALQAIQLTVGEPYREYMLQSDENSLAALISETGHPHATAAAAVLLSDDGTRAAVTYRVDEGPMVRMGQVYCSGNFITRSAVVTRPMRLKPGDPFSLKQLIRDQQAIRDLPVFASVRFRTVGLKEQADTVHLFVDVEEKKPYYLEAGLGYDTEKGVFADGRLGNRNLMGTLRDVRLSGTTSEIGSRVELGLADPEFAGLPISADFSLYDQRLSEFNQDFSIKSTGAAAVFSHRWNKRLRTSMGFRIESRQQFDKDAADALVPEELDRRTLLVTTPSVQYDTRDSVIRPRKGLLSTVSMDISKGLESDVDDFLKTTVDLRYFHTPINRLTLAFMGRLGFLDPFGSAGKVPEDQLFFLGGTADVRGFNENLLQIDAGGEPLGGRITVAGTVEARIDLGRQVELACFFDTGRVSETLAAAAHDTDQFRSSVGIGFRYVTPIGPVGLLYGHKLDRKPGESAGRIHFTIGYTF